MIPNFANFIQNNRIMRMFQNPQLMQGETGGVPDASQLAGQPDVTPSPDTPSQLPNQGIDIAGIMSQFAPTNVASDRYNQLVQQVPIRNKPSVLQRIAAAIATAGAGVQPAGMAGGGPVGLTFNPKAAEGVGDQIKYGKYFRQMEDYNAKLKPAEEAAKLEDTDNTNKRMLALGEISRIQQSEKDAETERKDKEREAGLAKLNEIKEADAKTRRDTLALNEWKAKHPLAKFQEVDGKLFALDPGTKESTPVMGADGKQIEGMSELTKLQTQLHNSLTEIAARGVQSRETKGTPDVGKADTPTQEKIRAYNRARQASVEHPEWKKYIKLDTNGPNTFDIAAPSTGGVFSSGPDANTYKAISDYVMASNVTPNKGAPDKVEPGMVKIIGPNGKTGQVSVADSKKLPKGWSVVGSK